MRIQKQKVSELCVANTQIIVNYVPFLEENKFFEETFKIYEKGVKLFTFPLSFELWNIFFSKCVKRYVSPIHNNALNERAWSCIEE